MVAKPLYKVKNINREIDKKGEEIMWNRMGLLVLVGVVGLVAGCSNLSEGDEFDRLVSIKSVKYLIENVDSSFSGVLNNLFVSAVISYSFPSTLTNTDFQAVSIRYSNYLYGTGTVTHDATNKQLYVNRYYNPSEGWLNFGTWSAHVQLTGTSYAAYEEFKLREPGTLSPTTKTRLVPETTGIAGDVSALARASVGTFSKTGTELTINFTVNDLRVMNGCIWLYNASGLLIGWTNFFINDNGSTRTLLPGGINKSGGTNTVTINSATVDSGDFSDYASIKHFVVVLTDGAQYAGHTQQYDYRSISAVKTY